MNHDLKQHVLSIVSDIENGRPCESCTDCGATLGKSSFCPECETRNPDTLSGFDYIQDVLDINWVLDNHRKYKGARLLVAFGGPNIWINTDTQTVEGHWWGDSFTVSYSRDEMDINGACSELFNC
jgi:hypothetical protein